ncbi:amino acid ABC transporter permease [Falsiroseomonas sp. HW251]|uniref:amino acid ABC transporter permease n=1 Tax=Falsiroseomonas sp. HW251 TaxID=3390998 RepID=UPI003D31BB8B
MSYVFQFGIVWDHWPKLLEGAWLTLRLSAASLLLGLALSVALAFGRRDGPRWVRALVGAYVEVIRNTPFLVQLFILYFTLPALGLRMDAWQAALIGMALNFAGYGCEIVRSGMEAVPRGQLEAARALGLTPLRIFRHVVAPQAIAIAWPALASQAVLLMLGSSLVSAISVEELTAVTNSLQSTTFRSFEFYFVATALYLVMALALRVALDGLHWALFRRGRPVERRQ